MVRIYERAVLLASVNLWVVITGVDNTISRKPLTSPSYRERELGLAGGKYEVEDDLTVGVIEYDERGRAVSSRLSLMSTFPDQKLHMSEALGAKQQSENRTVPEQMHPRINAPDSPSMKVSEAGDRLLLHEAKPDNPPRANSDDADAASRRPPPRYSYLCRDWDKGHIRHFHFPANSMDVRSHR